MHSSITLRKRKNMKSTHILFNLIVLSFLIVSIFILFCGQKPGDDLFNYAQTHKNDLRFGTYITVGAVKTHLNDTDGRREALSVIKSLGITKVFIETYRGGTIADEKLLVTIRDFFIQNEIDVVGGIATVPGKDFGARQEGQLGWFNYQHPKTQQDLEKVVRLTACVFDEMIIDDFLCSADTSELSNRARGEKSWSQYRMDLLTDLSENLFIKTARDEKSDVTIIIKYPQWYDRFHKFGYDVVREPKLYDKVWVGTETRGPITQRMGFVQPYEGFVNFRWLNSCSNGKVAGAWFDHIDCNEFDFINQAYQTILAGAKEIVLFNYYDLMNGHRGHHFLRRQFSSLVELAKMVAQQPVKGIYGYKPPHSDNESEYYIFDYMGMIGVPLLPTSQYPENADVIFLPSQAAIDKNLIEKMETSISNGKTIVITPGLIKALSNDEQLLKLAGIQSMEYGGETQIKNIIWENTKIPLQNPVYLPAKMYASGAQLLLVGENGRKGLPFLTKKEHPSGGKVFVLNVHTFTEADFKAINEVLLAPKPIPWLQLPHEWLNVVRESFLEPLKISFKAEGRISLHLFADEFVVCNFNDHDVKTKLNLEKYVGKEKGLNYINKLTGKPIQIQDNELVLPVKKRQFLWVGRE